MPPREPPAPKPPVWTYEDRAPPGGPPVRVVWTAAAIATVNPSRAHGLRAPWVPLAPGDAWRRVRELAAENTRARRGEGDHDASFGLPLDAARALLASNALPAGAPDVDALAAMVAHFGRYDSPAELVDLWVGLGDLALAARVVRRATEALTARDRDTPPRVMQSVVDRLRHALASAPEVLYADARDAVAPGLESAPLAVRTTVAFAFPSERAWGEAVIRECLARERPPSAAAHDAFTFVADAELATALIERWGAYWPAAHSGIPRRACDLVANLGADAAAPLAKLLAGRGSDARAEPVARALALIESPEAASTLVPLLGSRAFQQIVTRYCERAPAFARASLELVAARAVEKPRGAKSAGDDGVVGLARTLLARASEPAALAHGPAATAHAPIAATAPVTAAAVTQPGLPAVLAAPPWLAPRSKRASVITLEPLACEERLAWLEDDAGSFPEPATFDPDGPDAARNRRALGEMGPKKRAFVSQLAALPRDEALAIWSAAEPAGWFGGEYDGEGVLAALHRFGLDGLPGLYRYASGKLASALPALRRVRSPRAAPFIAEALFSARRSHHAEDWLLAFPEEAAAGLIPPALGTAGKAQRAAANALRFVAATGSVERVRAVAMRYGAEAASAVERVLREDHPERVPALPAWLATGELAPPRLREGHAPIAPAAVETLVTVLAFSPIAPAYSGLADVRAACDPASLGAFAWSLFEQWHARGAEPAHDWAMMSLAHFGDDASAARLADHIKRWPGQGASKRAERGLDALAGLGTDMALLHLDVLANHARSRPLRRAAEECSLRVARMRRLEPDDLEDRRAPDLGLARDGTRELIALGATTYELAFDEQLRPLARDVSSAKVHRTLPRPGAGDDRALHALAAARWKSLTKGAALVADAQIERLERAMSHRRRWTADAWDAYLLRHPLLVHLVRRLVWGLYSPGPDGAFVRAFRVAEDSSLADERDAPAALPADVLRVGVAHPLDLGDAALARWGGVFGDYELLQPFEQLSRATFAVRDDERRGDTLRRAIGREISWEKLASLERRGWTRHSTAGGRVMSWYKPRASRARLVLGASPGLDPTDPRASGDQRVTDARLEGGAADLGAAHPVEFSEVAREFARIG